MDFSIVIPVFNRAELTRACLRVLPASIADAGEGETIVVDNASTDSTAAVLAEFPWVRVIRNERNLGFAAANNQGARIARGEFLVLLNNDTQPQPGWLRAMLAVAREPDVGAVGARLLFPNGTIQHAGVVVAAHPFGRATLGAYHFAAGARADDPAVRERHDYQAVTGACLVTPRELYATLGGLDEAYWNGYEDVDYCFKVGARGLRVVYEPAAVVVHYESQSGAQRFRKVKWNVALLDDRWRAKARFDAARRHTELATIRFTTRQSYGTIENEQRPTPPTTVVVHGAGAGPSDATLRANRSPIEGIVRCDDAEAVARTREAMALRGQRYVAVVRSDTRLDAGWLDTLIAQVEVLPNLAAATYASELPLGENVATLAADARCTLLALARIPAHIELRDGATLDGAVAELLLRELALERGTRGVPRALGQLGPVTEDAEFARAQGMELRAIFDTSTEAVERVLRARSQPVRGLVSIVTLSWNAPSFTQKALASIRAHTSEPYEVIVVDNGSDGPTRAMLQAIDDPHVRVIYNPTNRGFAGGSNDGMAAARGEYTVLLNNDVIVPAGWLDGLLAPFGRIPGLGVTAPRSNKVAGHQLLADALYPDERAMLEFAAQRRETWAGTGYITDRAIGLCLCVDRRVIEAIGGFDERFGMGNFEDDDFCLRVRAAGYGIYICDDVFIHHFGSQSFAANNVDYAASMRGNWSKFAQKWGYPPAFPENGYEPRHAFTKGFDRARHYVPLAAVPAAPPVSEDLPGGEAKRLTFLATVRDESEWSAVAEFAARYLRAFDAKDPVTLAIATFGKPVAEVAGRRVARIVARAKGAVETCADVDIGDEDDAAAWRARFADARTLAIDAVADPSPSGLRRLLARLD